tara:strand:+ start:409 stop:630 length:222 start_codon:yes stop_codon:yes gene_type:complete
MRVYLYSIVFFTQLLADNVRFQKAKAKIGGPVRKQHPKKMVFKKLSVRRSLVYTLAEHEYTTTVLYESSLISS